MGGRLSDADNQRIIAARPQKSQLRVRIDCNASERVKKLASAEREEREGQTLIYLTFSMTGKTGF